MRLRTRRVTHWHDGKMILRWAAAEYLETERHFRCIIGYKSLWILETALGEEESASGDAAMATKENENHELAMSESAKTESTPLPVAVV